jgi:hypothetical protein
MSYQQPPPPEGLPYPGPAPKLPKPPKPRIGDPLAVALGNASLLGLGYFLIRRWFFGLLGLAGTAVLLVLMYQRKDVGYQYGLLGWGLLQVLHGILLAYRQPIRTASIPKRIIAAVVTLAMVSAGVLLKRDAAGVADEVTAAREAGDCARVAESQDEVWFGDRLVAGHEMDRGDRDVEICGTLDEAKQKLRDATSSADVAALKAGYAILGKIAGDPRQQRTAGAVMDTFVGDLQSMQPCRLISLTDWLRVRKLTRNLLDRANPVVLRIEPKALLACANDHAARKDWQSAHDLYQDLLKTYPKSKQAVSAKAGIYRATLEIQLGNVRELVSNGEYCSSPARYSGAPRYGRGVNKAIFLGEADEYFDDLPKQWKTEDPYRASAIICTEEPGDGAAVRTCPYTPLAHPDIWPTDVTFRKIAVPVKVYELRSGRLVSSQTVQIDGTVCPQTLHWTTYVDSEYYVPSEQNVAPTVATIQAAFRPLVVR